MSTHTYRLGSDYGHGVELVWTYPSLHLLFWEVS